jgi:integrase
MRAEALPSPTTPLSWSKRYGAKHRLVRILDFPQGIAGPKKVRIYRRQDHYVLQWWDPAAKGNLSDRVEGDLVAAIAKARQIEERLTHFRSSGQGCRHLGHPELVKKFCHDLARRADAGEIDPRSVTRYGSALNHYLAFVEQPQIENSFPHIAGVNRNFQLEFAGFLNQRAISSNGHPNTAHRIMKNPGYVEDAVRAMYQWAADPDRGHLLPDGFRNPFLGAARQHRRLVHDPVGTPDITMVMAVDFLGACDAYQLGLFAPLVFFGLRAAEPAYLFREHLRNGWLQVPCIPELAILTKGRRSKHLPVLPCLEAVWKNALQRQSYGLLYLRRAVIERQEQAPLREASLPDLIAEFQARCTSSRTIHAAEKIRLRDQLLKDAGGLSYDQVEGEFHRVAGKLGWPRQATVKDFRHLFSTSLENAGVPLYFRQYLMGQAPTKAPITPYTHLAPDRLHKHYDSAIRKEFKPALKTLADRINQLGL